MDNSVVADNKQIDAKKVFINDLVWVFSIQTIFQIIFTALLMVTSKIENLDQIQYLNISAYFLIFLLCLRSLQYTIANRALVILFMIEFFYLTISSSVLLLTEMGNEPSQQYYNIYVTAYYGNQIIITTIMLYITSYLFFFSISPKKENTKKHLIFALIIVAAIILLSFSNVPLFSDYYNGGGTYVDKVLNNIMVNSKYVYLINLSFLLFIWFTYNQGHYILSEYLPSIIAIQTLMITNEVYQLHNKINLIAFYIPALYFNAVVNLGFIFLALIRLNYLSRPESKKNEKYVLNYDLLKGYVDKPHRNFWESVLIKLGKQRLYIISIILFIIISIPLVFLGDISFFTRFNIILMFLFVVGVMIYAIVYTQRKWHNHIGFLMRRDKK